MISHGQIDILLESNTRREILANIDADPARVALKAKKDGALISTQIKYLQKARHKIPSFYNAGCIIEPLAYEQCSSEIAANCKQYSGDLCIDLTCGMGVDTFHFSHNFKKVISIERSEELHRITCENMKRLGVSNVEIINDTAEEFLCRFEGKADLIYVDPARRSESGNKLYLLEHCSPNVCDLLEVLLQKTNLLVIKASPMFDIKEAFRIFGEGITVEAVSTGGECKELIIEVDPNKRNNPEYAVLKATIAGKESTSFTVNNGIHPKAIGNPKYLLIADVSIYKIRKTRQYAAVNGFACDTDSDTGYLFSDTKPDNFFGRVFEIDRTLPYNPKKLKAVFKADTIKQADILKKNFPFNAAEIARATGIKEGGTTKIAFTTINGSLTAIILKNE